MRPIRGQTVVITGATSGIGREAVRAFARSGANVVAAGRREDRLQDLVRDVEARGGTALAVRTDVADEGQVASLIEQAVARFGRLDVLVNNAGVSLTARFEEQSLDDFRRVMEVNFWGAVYGCKAAVPVMKAQRQGGVIINISSILGRRGVPFETAYCASKFALRGFSEALRVEVMSSGIQVSTVFPGLVETEMTAGEAGDNQLGIPIPKGLPMLPARELARVLVEDARFPQPEIIMAADALMMNFFSTFAPGAMDALLGQSVPLVEALSGQSERDRGERA